MQSTSVSQALVQKPPAGPPPKTGSLAPSVTQVRPIAHTASPPPSLPIPWPAPPLPPVPIEEDTLLVSPPIPDDAGATTTAPPPPRLPDELASMSAEHPSKPATPIPITASAASEL